MYELALKSWQQANDPYPIWGTCLGFELLTVLSSNGQNHLTRCWSEDQALALKVMEDEWHQSGIGHAMPIDVLDILKSQEATINFHRWCLTPQNFSFYQFTSEFTSYNMD